MRPALPCEKTGRHARNTPIATANTRIHAPVFKRKNFIPTPSYDPSSLGLSQFQVSGPTLFQGLRRSTHVRICKAYITAKFKGSSLIPVIR